LCQWLVAISQSPCRGINYPQIPGCTGELSSLPFSLKFGLDNGRNRTTLIASKNLSSGLFLSDGGCFVLIPPDPSGPGNAK
jgi:hypothetical protein